MLHDLKHSFASSLQQFTDIATLRELTSNSSQSLDVYLHTNPTRMREAMRKMENVNLDGDLSAVFDKIKEGEIDRISFLEMVKKLFG